MVARARRKLTTTVPASTQVTPASASRVAAEASEAQHSFRAPFDGRTLAAAEDLRPAEAILNEQFLDEDHLTNKSGDPRIGTHNRKYEP